MSIYILHIFNTGRQTQPHSKMSKENTHTDVGKSGDNSRGAVEIRGAGNGGHNGGRHVLEDGTLGVRSSVLSELTAAHDAAERLSARGEGERLSARAGALELVDLGAELCVCVCVLEYEYASFLAIPLCYHASSLLSSGVAKRRQGQETGRTHKRNLAGGHALGLGEDVIHLNLGELRKSHGAIVPHSLILCYRRARERATGKGSVLWWEESERERGVGRERAGGRQKE